MIQHCEFMNAYTAIFTLHLAWAEQVTMGLIYAVLSVISVA